MYKKFLKEHILGRLALKKIEELRRQGFNLLTSQSIVRQELCLIVLRSKTDNAGLNLWERRITSNANFVITPEQARCFIHFFKLEDIDEVEFKQICHLSTLQIIKKSYLKKVANTRLFEEYKDIL